MDIKATIENQISETNAELDRMRAALAALDGFEAQAQPTQRKPVQGRTRRQSVTHVALSPDAVMELVTVEGVARSDIAAQLNASDDKVVAILKALEADGKVKRSGNKRSTLWQPVSDEDRVNARRAELEAQQAQTLAQAKRKQAARKSAETRRRKSARAPVPAPAPLAVPALPALSAVEDEAAVA